MSPEPIDLETRLQSIRKAARALRSTPGASKNRALNLAASKLSERSEEILRANQEDLANLDPGTTSAFRDRLMLSAIRLDQIREGLTQVEALHDPVGELVEQKTLANGLKLRRVRSPLGVIFMIFESRPNVAIESFSLAFKAGNAVILRGGKESMRTTGVLYSILQEALVEARLPSECLWGITDPDRALMERLLKQRRLIDVVVPRGGAGLIDFVTSTSEIPVIKHDRGMCHVYVHEDADLKMAEDIIANSKCQRPGVCNAMETMLIHEKIALKLLPSLYFRLSGTPAVNKLEWFVSPEAGLVLGPQSLVRPAAEKNWDTEYLDFKVNCRIVKSVDEAIEHIEKHGSSHSEAIVTQTESVARHFQNEVDAAAVYWNASTRFTDGFEFGLGGELGISTQKLHVRGPVGLRELTSARWIGDGKGQVVK